MRTEEVEGGTETAVIHALHDTLPPIFQEREVVENLTKGLVEFQLLAKAKERGKCLEWECRIRAANGGRFKGTRGFVEWTPENEFQGSTGGGAKRWTYEEVTTP